MSSTPSLSGRLRSELTNDLTVSIVSVLLAVVALYSVARLADTGAFLLAINIAVFIPYVYERYWPVTYSPGSATVWTISAVLITTGLFLGTFQLASDVAGEQYGVGIAFIVTVVVQYGIATLFRRAR